MLRVALQTSSSAPKITLSGGDTMRVLLGRVLDTDDIMHAADYERAEGIGYYHATDDAIADVATAGDIALFDAANVNRLSGTTWSQLSKVTTVMVSNRAYVTASGAGIGASPSALTGHDDPTKLYIRDGLDPTAALATFTVSARGARDAAGFYKLTGTMTVSGAFPPVSQEPGRLQIDFVRDAHKTIDPAAIRDTSGLVRGDDADTPKGFVVLPATGDNLQWRTPAQAHDDVVGGAPDMSQILHGADDGFVVSNDGSAGIMGMNWFRAMMCIMFGTQLTDRKKVVANNGIANTDDAFDMATVGGQRRLFIANGSDGSYVAHIGVGDIIAFWTADYATIEAGTVTGEHQWLNDRQINIDNVVSIGSFTNNSYYKFTLLSRQKLANAAL